MDVYHLHSGTIDFLQNWKEISEWRREPGRARLLEAGGDARSDRKDGSIEQDLLQDRDSEQVIMLHVEETFSLSNSLTFPLLCTIL